VRDKQSDRERRLEAMDAAIAKMSDDEIAERLEEVYAERETLAEVPVPVSPPSPPAASLPAPTIEGARERQQAREIGQTLALGAISSLEEFDTAVGAAAERLLDIAPRDPVEEMLATQMLALHSAAMDCNRRAMLPGQPGEFRRLELGLAAKTSRAFAQLADTLDRRRRGGKQKVTVEHVHVHNGGQAIVGNVRGGRGGMENDKG